MARSGKVEALMKGGLHTDELMRAVVNGDHGLCTSRRISHVFVVDLPNYPRPLFITDAAINIYPTLEDKGDIVRNAIDLAHALGIAMPKVAILSAVETVSPKIRSTLDAAALCKMAERGQITGGIIDGPLAFDNAISAEAAQTKGIVSAVAGAADIPIWKPVICWPSSLSIWLAPRSPASCSARASPSSSPVVPTKRWRGSDLQPSRFFWRGNDQITCRERTQPLGEALTRRFSQPAHG